MDAIPVLDAVATAQARGARCTLMQRCSIPSADTWGDGLADDRSWTQPAQLSDTANEVLLQVEYGGRRSLLPLLHAAEAYYIANGWCQPTAKPFPALVSRRGLREALEMPAGTLIGDRPALAAEVGLADLP